MIKAVIFDMDGVLRDSAKINVLSAKKSFQQFGLTLDARDKDIIVGRHHDDYLPLLRRKYRFDAKKYKLLNSRNYFTLLKDVRLLPFTKKTLLLLRQNKLKLALATASNRNDVEEFLIHKFSLSNFFEVIITFEDCRQRKPNPEIYLNVLGKLHLPAREAVAVEDSEVGVEAAKRAGLKCIAIPNGYTKNENFSRADLIIHSLAELDLKLLSRLA
ncbi:MAG TPA: HAD family phosphatase [Candidatus Nanoarchaeia archaeon]|nr:HAD family phosphatase [Candidatus Nanoarchaeia archaeon]